MKVLLLRSEPPMHSFSFVTPLGPGNIARALLDAVLEVEILDQANRCPDSNLAHRVWNSVVINPAPPWRICQFETQASAADRHRRDCHRQGTTVLSRGAQLEIGRGGARGRRQRHFGGWPDNRVLPAAWPEERNGKENEIIRTACGGDSTDPFFVKKQSSESCVPGSGPIRLIP